MGFRNVSMDNKRLFFTYQFQQKKKSDCDFASWYQKVSYKIMNIDFFYAFISFFEPRYAYAVASALHGVQHILRKDFMLQACLFFCKVLHITGDFHF